MKKTFPHLQESLQINQKFGKIFTNSRNLHTIYGGKRLFQKQVRCTSQSGAAEQKVALQSSSKNRGWLQGWEQKFWGTNEMQEATESSRKLLSSASLSTRTTFTYFCV